MRLYYDSSIARIFSALGAVVALAVFGFTVWKALEVWQADPTLQNIQELWQRQQQNQG